MLQFNSTTFYGGLPDELLKIGQFNTLIGDVGRFVRLFTLVANYCFKIITYLDVTPSILFFCIAETT